MIERQFTDFIAFTHSKTGLATLSKTETDGTELNASSENELTLHG
ncbi:hypothetical protein [Methylobacter sp.]